MVSGSLKQLYSTVYSQAYSKDKSLLAVGNSEGEIVVYDLQGLVARRHRGGGDRLKQPYHRVSAHQDAVYAMTETPVFCITGATGSLAGWRWSDLKSRSTKPAWTISLECDQANFGTPEVNGLTYDSKKNLVYAACGDWRTRVFDMETGKNTLTLEGHDDYVHDVVCSGNLIVSCGEDGAVLGWDPRASREPRIKLKPYTQNQLNRPDVGKFIASVDVENDWLVCGGGPQAGVFHLRSLALTTVLPPKEAPIHVTKFTKPTQGGDRGGIVVAGVSPNVFVCSMSGEVTAQIPSYSPCVYTVYVTDQPSLLLTIGGMSSKIDVCLNLNYRDHAVTTFSEEIGI